MIYFYLGLKRKILCKNNQKQQLPLSLKWIFLIVIFSMGSLFFRLIIEMKGNPFLMNILVMMSNKIILHLITMKTLTDMTTNRAFPWSLSMMIMNLILGRDMEKRRRS
jgi:cation transport ATPase